MDVFCLPSFYEGMPVVAWEAQANGLQCVFSTEVSKEASKSIQCKFISLDETVLQWEKVLTGDRKLKDYSAFDIQDQVTHLMLYYYKKEGSQ